MRYSGAEGKLNQEKNQKQKNIPLRKNTRKSGQIIIGAANSMQCQTLFLHQEGGRERTGKKHKYFLCSKNENNCKFSL